MPALSPQDARLRLRTLPGWEIEDSQLTRTFLFAGFPAAIAFVDRLAVRAEEAGHHPDILIRYNRVQLTLVTHDAGGLTEKDFSLAADASALAG
ncbi:MAG: 4a-hydroxytetrahydrobiopterin dehydratase [Terracidiphilus sp.]